VDNTEVEEVVVSIRKPKSGDKQRLEETLKSPELAFNERYSKYSENIRVSGIGAFGDRIGVVFKRKSHDNPLP
jgi:hypothetical protein